MAAGNGKLRPLRVTTARLSRKIIDEPVTAGAGPNKINFPFRRKEERIMSIVRVGLGETEHFAEGYEAIFGKKDKKEENKDEKPQQGEQASGEKKKDEKK